MDSRPIMAQKSLCIMHLVHYPFQKPPTNFSDEAVNSTSYTQEALLTIRQHGKSAVVDSEDIGQLFHAIDNPLATMFIAFTGMRIRAA
jgi:hypothetical protein